MRKKSIPRSQRKITNEIIQRPRATNRGEQISRKDDKIKNISVGLKDIDESIMYYFKNVIKPRITENGNLVNVPTRYGDPEMWKSVQKDGFIHDKKGKIIAPVIMYRRTGFSRDTEISSNKLARSLVQPYVKKWSSKNTYDKFSITNRLKPTYEYFNVVVPNYIIISYECVVWTHFINQMNKIVEQIQFSEGSYWGDKDKFKFRSTIDSFDQAVEISTDKGRIIKTNFTITIKGFLIPEQFNDLVTTQKQFTTQRVVLGVETEVNIEDLGKVPRKRRPKFQKEFVSIITPKAKPDVSVKVADEAEILNYLLMEKIHRTTKVIDRIEIGGDIEFTVFFDGAKKAYAPVGVPKTDKYDYIFFCNGAYIEHDAIREIDQDSNGFKVKISTNALGYEITTGDEVHVFGLFEK